MVLKQTILKFPNISLNNGSDEIYVYMIQFNTCKYYSVLNSVDCDEPFSQHAYYWCCVVVSFYVLVDGGNHREE